ncbi:GNAT family N-acetyltransferase [Pseudoruegeria sp. HB172150]|uniref:GNAT family N-acetyltransferase n=1 Tax=Pseudoruegeria sp. HB172150 TaxID=2721164 RepID=UPI001555E3FF|nr:GNAT family N-acetyltransferase [Pseudoruegeria sp. HB172150]
MNEPHIRHATLAELETALDWAAAEGWNPGLADATAFYKTDPRGFFVALIDDVPVASISVVNHSDDFAFLGLYICKEEFRGRGIGYQLWTQALEHAGDRTVGLDGVAAQQANYEKSGFVRAGASRRFAGKLTGHEHKGIRPIVPADKPALFALDRDSSGYERTPFLDIWLGADQRRATVITRETPGSATIRLCRDGCKIGPILAPDTETALRLAEAAVAQMSADTVFIDVAPGNEALAAALDARGFEETFATARMYRGTAPVAGPALQAIATMELG